MPAIVAALSAVALDVVVVASAPLQIALILWAYRRVIRRSLEVGSR